jgi:alkylation response protein AidB-like acyl-CoA dehydrogenase
MYDLQLTGEQIQFRHLIRDFVAQDVKPVALRSARLEAFDRPLLNDALDKASQIGLRTMALSEENGGAGADSLTRCIVIEELAAGDPDIAAVLSVTSSLGHLLFDRLLSPAQRDRFLPEFLSDHHCHLSCGLHEEADDTRLGIRYHSSSPADRVATIAEQGRDGHWIVNGAKQYVLNASLARLFVVSVAVPGRQRPALALIPRDAPGISINSETKLRLKCHGVGGQVSFTNCSVPGDHLIDPGENDLAALMVWLGAGSVFEQAIDVGIGRAAYEAALEYAQIRIQGVKRIIEHQAIGTKLAEIAIALDLARAAVWRAAYASDHPEAVSDGSLPDLPLDLISRCFVGPAVYRATKDAAEVFGAMGVMRDMPLHKYISDSLLLLHSGTGISDIKLRIAELLAGYKRP